MNIDLNKLDSYMKQDNDIKESSTSTVQKMKPLRCEMCGGTDIIKTDGVFMCQNCGMKYSADEVKKMMIEGTVDVKGTVTVDNSTYVKKCLANAHRALAKQDWEEVEKYYNLVEQNTENNMEAVFFSSFGKAMLSMTDQDYFKRKQKFEVLIRSMSVISDYYDVTTENKEEVLRLIADNISVMFSTTYVYNRQAYSSSVGGRGWCKTLLYDVKNAFITELKQIKGKHTDTYLDNILNELVSNSNSNKTDDYVFWRFLAVLALIIIVFNILSCVI